MSKFQKLFQKSKKDLAQSVIHVVSAADKEIIESLALVQKDYPVQIALYDEAKVLEELVQEFKLEAKIIDCQTWQSSLEQALKACHQDENAVLMKGLINTADFLRGVLNRDYGLRSDSLLSHMAVYDLPGYHKLLYCSDSGFNNSPDLEAKKLILANAYNSVKKLGLKEAKIAFLTANEQVNPKVVSTTDAKALVDFVQSEGYAAIAEGPISFDIAFSPEAAKHKGVKSQISGDLDLIIFPNLESGNILGKSWLHFAKATWAGTILGAKRPIILGSRSDTAEIKVNSILLALML